MQNVTITYFNEPAETFEAIGMNISPSGVINIVEFNDISTVLDYKANGIKRLVATPIKDEELDKQTPAFQAWYEGAKKVAEARIAASEETSDTEPDVS